jgi:hypothetical protein
MKQTKIKIKILKIVQPSGYNSKYRSNWSLSDLATEWMDKASGESPLSEGLTCEDLVNGYLARNNGKPDPFPE